MKKIPFITLTKDDTLFLKGLAIVLVFFGHMNNYIPCSGSWGVDLFLILSGYGVFKSYLKNNNKSFFKNKILKIFVPYFIYMLILIIFLLLRNNQLSTKQIVFSLAGLDFTYILDKTMWYISYIFLFYIVFFVSCLINNLIFKKKKNNFFLTILILSGAFLIKYIASNTNAFGVLSCSYIYWFAFPLGVILSQISECLINEKLKKVIFSFVFLISFTTILALYNNFGNNYWLSFKIYSIAFPILMISLIQFGFFSKYNKFFKFVGSFSFEAYLWEWFILAYASSYFSLVTDQLLLSILKFILFIIIPYAFNKLVTQTIIDLFEKKVK